MSDDHTMTLDYQVAQSRKVKNLEDENGRLRALADVVIRINSQMYSEYGDHYYPEGSVAEINAAVRVFLGRKLPPINPSASSQVPESPQGNAQATLSP